MRQTVIFINYVFLYFTGWLVNVNDSVAAEFNMFVTSKSYGNVRCFDQHYQPQDTVLIIECLVAVSYEFWMVLQKLYFWTLQQSGEEFLQQSQN